MNGSEAEREVRLRCCPGADVYRELLIGEGVLMCNNLVTSWWNAVDLVSPVL